MDAAVAHSSGAAVPTPAYLPTSTSSPLLVDWELYSRIVEAPRRLVYSYTLAPRSGHGWLATAGSIIRISTPSGPQVGDLNVWSASNPRERFWAARTKQLHRAHVGVGDRLWSCLPYLRPMVTILADTLQDFGQGARHKGDGESVGPGERRSERRRGVGAREGVHDLLGTRCDPYVNKMLSSADTGPAGEGEEYDFHCHSNLVRAVLPFGLTEFDVHDVINLFQVTGLDSDDRYFMDPCPAKPGDYIEFFAEIDVLMALSTCPGGDLSQWAFGGGEEGKAKMKECCRDLKIEVYEIDQDARRGWIAPKVSSYRGMHGLKMPQQAGR